MQHAVSCMSWIALMSSLAMYALRFMSPSRLINAIFVCVILALGVRFPRIQANVPVNLVRFVPVCAVSVAGMDPDFVKEIGEFERSNRDFFLASRGGASGRRGRAPQGRRGQAI